MLVENIQQKLTVLALEVRPRVTGFALLDATPRLLDYGMRKHRVRDEHLTHLVARKINALFDLYSPAVIVVRSRNVWSRKARGRISVIIRIVRREAKGRSIELRTISANSVHHFFARHGCATKQQTATFIAGWLPELVWKIPPKRKSWKSEHHRMVVFDAAATCLAFLSRSPPGNT